MNGNESKNGEKLDKLDKKIEELETISAQKPTLAMPSQTGHTNAWQKILMIIVWIAAIAYIFIKFGFIGIDLLGNLLVNIFSFITVPMVWGIFPGDAYIVIMAGFTVLMFYLDIFLIFPLTYIFSIKKDPLERMHSTINLQLIGLVIIAIPLLTTSLYIGVFGTNPDEQQQTMDNFEINTKSKWQQLVEGPLCPLINLNNPQICIKQEQEVEAEKTSRIEYEVYFNAPDFNYVDDLQRWQSKPFYLNYEIQAKGEPVYLDRIECWENSIDREGENLLSNISLENRQILSNDRTPITGAECDVSDITTDKHLEKDFKLIAVLYYELESSYTQPIPIYNMDIYLENKFGSIEGINILSEEAKLRESLGKIKPVVPNNAIKLSTYTAPSLPIMIGQDHDETNQYQMTFTFEKNSYSDKLVSSQIIDYKIPSAFEAECAGECETAIKGPIATYNDKSQIILGLTITNPQTERESYEENLEFKVRSKFKKTNYIPLVINNLHPTIEEETTTAAQTTTTSTAQTTTTTTSQDTQTTPPPQTSNNNNDPVEEILNADDSDPLQNDNDWELIYG